MFLTASSKCRLISSPYLASRSFVQLEEARQALILRSVSTEQRALFKSPTIELVHSKITYHKFI